MQKHLCMIVLLSEQGEIWDDVRIKPYLADCSTVFRKQCCSKHYSTQTVMHLFILLHFFFLEGVKLIAVGSIKYFIYLNLDFPLRPIKTHSDGQKDIPCHFFWNLMAASYSFGKLGTRQMLHLREG